MEKLSKYLGKDEVIVADDGAHLTWAIQSLKVLKNKDYFLHLEIHQWGMHFLQQLVRQSLLIKKSSLY